jgi:hypothetical protein
LRTPYLPTVFEDVETAQPEPAGEQCLRDRLGLLRRRELRRCPLEHDGIRVY